MAAGRDHKGSGRAHGKGGAAKRPLRRRTDPLPLAGMVRDAVASGGELLAVTDPLAAEIWASSTLGLFYKAPIPFEARLKLERSIGPELVGCAERRADGVGLAVLRALAAVTGDDLGAREAGARLAARGVPEPIWVDGIGTPRFLSAWAAADPYDDQIGYSLSFRYEGLPPHMLVALYDEGLGGIIKDASVGAIPEGVDPRLRFAQQDDTGVRIDDLDGGVAAARITRAIATGDLFLDNHWTAEFKSTRALLLARMRLLPDTPLPAPRARERDPREALVQEFLASPLAPNLPETRAIVNECLAARSDHGGGEPLHWSPAVVELLLVDLLPRRATLSEAELRAVPEVLCAWVRFALTRRGREERWIVETEASVHELAAELASATGAPRSFDPAGATRAAMLSAGVDLSDTLAVDAWLAGLSVLPETEGKGFSTS